MPPPVMYCYDLTPILRVLLYYHYNCSTTTCNYFTTTILLHVGSYLCSHTRYPLSDTWHLAQAFVSIILCLRLCFCCPNLKRSGLVNVCCCAPCSFPQTVHRHTCPQRTTIIYRQSQRHGHLTQAPALRVVLAIRGPSPWFKGRSSLKNTQLKMLRFPGSGMG